MRETAAVGGSPTALEEDSLRPPQRGCRVGGPGCSRGPQALFGFRPHLEYRQKSFLRNLDATDALHPLLAFLLFLEQLPFPRDVAAVAFCEHVLPQRLHR